MLLLGASEGGRRGAASLNVWSDVWDGATTSPVLTKDIVRPGADAEGRGGAEGGVVRAAAAPAGGARYRPTRALWNVRC
eukprot:1381098-Rhodomonas_salina.1